MSYNYFLVEVSIHIPVGAFQEILEAVNELAIELGIQTNTEITSLFENFGWEVYTDRRGNIIDLDWTLNSLYRTTELFETIAPWVANGSFVHMRTEEHDHFRYLFYNKTCKIQDGKIVFE